MRVSTCSGPGSVTVSSWLEKSISSGNSSPRGSSSAELTAAARSSRARSFRIATSTGDGSIILVSIVETRLRGRRGLSATAQNRAQVASKRMRNSPMGYLCA